MDQPSATYLLEFDVVAIEANSGGVQTGNPGHQIHVLTLSGAQGQKLMLSFSSSHADVSVQKQDPSFYLIENPLSEHAPTMWQLRAIIPRSVKVRIVEAANGVTSWQFTGRLA